VYWGCPNCPVQKAYNLWLVILGGFMIFSGVNLYIRYEYVSRPLSVMAMSVLTLYGIGGGILSGIFSNFVWMFSALVQLWLHKKSTKKQNK
jgi:hypothetical protein